jgi:hypothetical protein
MMFPNYDADAAVRVARQDVERHVAAAHARALTKRARREAREAQSAARARGEVAPAPTWRERLHLPAAVHLGPAGQ